VPVGVQLGPGEVLENVEILCRTGPAITGRVVGPGGGELARCRVVIRREDGDSEFWRSAWCDPDGAFEFRNLQPGTYALTASLPGLVQDEDPGLASVRKEHVAAGTADVILKLPRTGRISGRVVRADGAPEVDAVVSAESAAGGPFYFDETDSDGRFDLYPPSGAHLDLAVTPRHPSRGFDELGRPLMDVERTTEIENVVAGTTDLVIRLKP
jgi:hypothetical protein